MTRVPKCKEKREKYYKFIIQPEIGKGITYAKIFGKRWFDIQIQILSNDKSVRRFFYKEIRYAYPSKCTRCSRKSNKKIDFCPIFGSRVQKLY